jgi:hypothetical protein
MPAVAVVVVMCLEPEEQVVTVVVEMEVLHLLQPLAELLIVVAEVGVVETPGQREQEVQAL